MISGFSNAATTHLYHHLAFNSAIPMPFKIPAVLKTLLDPDIDLNYTPQQSDLLEALRFSMKAKAKMLDKAAQHEAELLHKMMQEGQDTAKLKEEYDDIQTEKLEANEVFFDLINALAELLDASQYKALLEHADIKML
jgi:hypothetical protein